VSAVSGQCAYVQERRGAAAPATAPRGSMAVTAQVMLARVLLHCWQYVGAEREIYARYARRFGSKRSAVRNRYCCAAREPLANVVVASPRYLVV